MYILYAWFWPSAVIQFVEKSFITAKDTEVDRRYGRWFNLPAYFADKAESNTGHDGVVADGADYSGIPISSKEIKNSIRNYQLTLDNILFNFIYNFIYNIFLLHLKIFKGV